jgi:hypothetical protein
MARGYGCGYDYYTVQVPSDITGDERNQIAFNLASEKCRLYRCPAVWYIISDDGYNVKVARKFGISFKKGR